MFALRATREGFGQSGGESRLVRKCESAGNKCTPVGRTVLKTRPQRVELKGDVERVRFTIHPWQIGYCLRDLVAISVSAYVEQNEGCDPSSRHGLSAHVVAPGQ